MQFVALDSARGFCSEFQRYAPAAALSNRCDNGQEGTVIESRDSRPTGDRRKLQGMRWYEFCAPDMARLRIGLFNGRWRERAEQLIAA